MRENLIKVIEFKQRSSDRKTHRAFEATRSRTSGDNQLSTNMSGREVSDSNAPSRWQRVKRNKLAVMYALRMGSIAEGVQMYVMQSRHA